MIIFNTIRYMFHINVTASVVDYWSWMCWWSAGEGEAHFTDFISCRYFICNNTSCLLWDVEEEKVAGNRNTRVKYKFLLLRRRVFLRGFTLSTVAVCLVCWPSSCSETETWLLLQLKTRRGHLVWRAAAFLDFWLVDCLCCFTVFGSAVNVSVRQVGF